MTRAACAATPDELPALARLWEAGWHDAHDGLVPPALVALRTSESFLDRLPTTATRCASPVRPARRSASASSSGDEIDQLYVAPAARGTGLAATLLADGEARLAAAGVARRPDRLRHRQRPRAALLREAWLARRPGDDHARGSFELEVTLLRKRLGPAEDSPMRHDLDALPTTRSFPASTAASCIPTA